jgi:phage tail sheath gpL-like
VTSGDTAAEVSTAVDAAINALPGDNLQMTSAEATSVVTLTARNKGTLGNQIDVRLNYLDGEELPAGITATIATGVTGATDPDLATVITAIGDVQYHTIINAFADATNIGLLETELSTRWEALSENDGHAFHGAKGSASTLTTLGAARNSEHSTIFGVGLSPTTPWEAAAMVGAIDAFEPDPARPRQTLRINGMMSPAREAIFTRTARQSLLENGIATYVVDPAGNCSIGRLITTFQTDALSNDSTVFLDITTPRTLSRLRYDWRTRISTKYPRHKLADDGTLFSPGQAVITPSVIKGEAFDLFLTSWEPNGLVEDFDSFKDNIIVERNTSDPNRLDCLIAPDLVNQARIIATSVQFRL